MQVTRLFWNSVELANTSSGGDHFAPSVGDEVVVLCETYRVLRRRVIYETGNIIVYIYLERT